MHTVASWKCTHSKPNGNTEMHIHIYRHMRLCMYVYILRIFVHLQIYILTNMRKHARMHTNKNAEAQEEMHVVLNLMRLSNKIWLAKCRLTDSVSNQ